jgi:hypothetical protein
MGMMGHFLTLFDPTPVPAVLPAFAHTDNGSYGKHHQKDEE